jgi:hypothetical protein
MINLLKEKNYQKLNFFILLLASLILLRKAATIVIIVFFVFSLINYKEYYKDIKKHIRLGLIINIPILLECIFFWNNDSAFLGMKSLEKSISCLLLPYLIIPHFEYIDTFKILKKYSIYTAFILIISLISFAFFEHSYFMKYLNGIHLWQMGYTFSDFIGIHAPALNMYISFICVYILYLTINEFSNNDFSKKAIKLFLLFLVFFFFLLVINTRIAMLTFVLNAIILFVFSKIVIRKKIIIVILSVTILTCLTKIFIEKFPYTLDKYTVHLFNDMDKVGKLDEIDNPEIYAYTSLVTRISIWKSSYEVGKKNFLVGVGSSDAQKELIRHYQKTNQIFLTKYGFITHNQFLNFFIKYGIIGLIGCFIYIFYPLYLSIKTNSIIIFCFFLNFLISNITDDYLNKFDGLVYTALWYSIFTCYYLNNKSKL